jgi:hypothetical protein
MLIEYFGIYVYGQLQVVYDGEKFKNSSIYKTLKNCEILEEPMMTIGGIRFQISLDM